MTSKKDISSFSIVLLLVLLPFFCLAINDTIPLKVNGNWTNKNLKNSARSIQFEDTIGITHSITLLTENNVPALFTSHIETPVCSDSLCNLMDIRIYWTLAGSYLGFDTIPGKPLTKNDHLDFNTDDFEKLHKLLCDEQSILRRRHKDDLFDKVETRVSQVVDAVTGATSKEVKEITVDGAVYSSYTIYHLVHSQLSGVIKSYVRDSLLSQMDKRLSQSTRVEERVFFWQLTPAEKFPLYQKEIIETIETAAPKDRLFVMKKIPADMWNNNDFQIQLSKLSPVLDIYGISHFLNQLKTAPSIPVDVLYNLSKQTKSLSQNQLSTFLQLIEITPAALKNKALLQELQNAEQNAQYRFRTIVASFLKKHA